MSHQDDSWLNGEPLGNAIEAMRLSGNEWRRNRDGERGAFALYYIPQPNGEPWRRYLVVNAWSFKPKPEGAWSDKVTIQVEGGDTQTLGDYELAGKRGREHWRLVFESEEQRKNAAANGLEVLKQLIANVGKEM